ncbi:zinc ion binding transcription regulators [Euphorbia peplus]|nr:zinc ion binding transcription regulators [Euphorbia peplus]
MACYQCGHRSISRDDVTGSLVCESCGTVQRFDNYHAATWSADGPQGVFIRVGGSGSGSVLNYRDKKIFEANNLIDDITFKLDLISRRSEIKAMISKITDGEFGTGDWFRVLIGACAYVVVRSANKSLSIAEIGDVIGRDVHELGRMIARVVEHLGLELPEFDIVGSFEKVLRNLSSSGRIEGDKVERMREQGVFLIQCATKWFLTTGRRPLPIVAAVLVLVAELNGVPGMKIEEMARRVHAAVSTSKTRYRELLEAIVKAAQVLPWGKDVTVKNAVKNAPFVLRHMEMKLMAKDNGEECLGSGDFDLEEVVSQCLRKEVEYGIDVDATKSDESRYFEVGNDSSLNDVGVDDFDKLQLSHECLSMAYDKFLKEVGCGKFEGVTEKGQRGKSKRGVELHPAEWWNGKTELSKKLLLKQILEKDVGLNPMPPSFVNGVMAVERRQAKISAAKSRIEKIMHPGNADLSDTYEICVPEDLHARKKKRKTCAKDIDWEDFVIEMLLLHQVKEEEIEHGHYNTLLGLHVFNS